MADQVNAGETGSAAVSETTPLLGNEPQATGNEDAEQQPAAPVRDRDVVIGSWTSGSAAVLTIAFWFPVTILRQNEPPNYNLSWEVREALNPLAAMALVAALVAVFNLVRLYRRNIALPGAINIIVDIIIGFYVTVLSGSALGEFATGNHCYEYGQVPAEIQRCARFRLLIEPLVWIFILSSLVLGLTHVILFVYRCFKAYQGRGRFVGRTNGWGLPAGQFTVEFTVKFLRQTPDTARRDQNVQQPVQVQSA